jgi:hypothetical protein
LFVENAHFPKTSASHALLQQDHTKANISQEHCMLNRALETTMHWDCGIPCCASFRRGYSTKRLAEPTSEKQQPAPQRRKIQQARSDPRDRYDRPQLYYKRDPELHMVSLSSNAQVRQKRLMMYS